MHQVSVVVMFLGKYSTVFAMLWSEPSCSCYQKMKFVPMLQTSKGKPLYFIWSFLSVLCTKSLDHCFVSATCHSGFRMVQQFKGMIFFFAYNVALIFDWSNNMVKFMFPSVIFSDNMVTFMFPLLFFLYKRKILKVFEMNFEKNF